MTGELDNEPAFGGLLRAWRVGAGLTQDQLAEGSGLGIRTIRDLERGRVRRPHRESIGLLAAALDLPPAARDELARAGRRPLVRLRPVTAGAGKPMRPGPAADSAGSAGSAGRPVPRQLPPAIQHFAGRAEALRVLMGLIGEVPAPAGAVMISAIDGSAGIGKTALAVHWAHQVAERFPDGQLHVDLRGFDPGCSPLPPSEAIRGFLDALGVPPVQIPASPEALTARYRSLLAGRRMLVLLDNARDASQVRPLLPAAPGCLVIVTSRTRLLSLVAAEGAHPLTLDLLTVAEARELLARRMGARRFSRERDTADELIGLCARLPLALNIVAARAVGEPRLSLAALTGQLRDARHRLDMLDTGDRATDVRAAFSWSCQHVTPPAARMFRLLGGVHPGPNISAPAAASLAGVPLRQARQALAELGVARLVAEQPAGRFSLHDLLRAYAAEQAQALESETERRAALRRVLDHYLHTTCRAALLLAPARDPLTLAAPTPGAAPEDLADYAQALSWLEAERPVLLRAVTAATRAGLDAYAWQLPWGLSDFLPRRGHWQAYTVSQDTALAAGQRLADLEVQARARAQLGYAHGMLGNYRDASIHLQKALDLCRQLGDPSTEAIVNVMFAHLLGWQGRNSEARDHARQALEISQDEGSPAARANALNSLGWYSALIGEHRQALPHCARALDLLRDLGDSYGQAATLDSLGYIHHHLGHYLLALDYYQQSLSLFREFGDRYRQAGTLTGLGDTHHARGSVGAARKCWRQALAILTDLGHPDADAVRDKLMP